MTDRELMQQALAALENSQSYVEFDWVKNQCGRAITALRAAIEQTNDWDEVEALRASLREHMAEIHRLRAALEQAQKPVAWLVQYPNKHEFVWGERPQWIAGAIGIEPLYTAPRQWQGLTQREIDELWDLHHDDYGNALSATGYERAIEAKLRERNA